MARRGDGLDGEARSLKPLAVTEHRVGRVVAVVRGIEALGPVPLRCERLGADDARARSLPQPVRKRTVIAMGMGDEDRLDLFALDRGEDRREMGSVSRARIDDRDRAVADDIGAGAVEGEGRGVRRDEAAHKRGEPGQGAWGRLPGVGEEIRFALVSHSYAPFTPHKAQRPFALS